MRTSPEDFREVLNRVVQRAQRPMPTHRDPEQARLLQQAAVASENLTAIPEFDVFLQRIQALVDGTRKDLAAMAEHHALPNLTSEQILQGHRHILAAKERINAWEVVLQLPKQIIAERAKQTSTSGDKTPSN